MLSWLSTQRTLILFYTVPLLGLLISARGARSKDSTHCKDTRSWRWSSTHGSQRPITACAALYCVSITHQHHASPSHETSNRFHQVSVKVMANDQLDSRRERGPMRPDRPSP